MNTIKRNAITWIAALSLALLALNENRRAETYKAKWISALEQTRIAINSYDIAVASTQKAVRYSEMCKEALNRFVVYCHEQHETYLPSLPQAVK